ncbi:zinc finger BED domain-containing protein RICESLEEPER 2-like protein [Tanacetum coccineum]
MLDPIEEQSIEGGEALGQAVENYLIEWCLKNILTITVDNVSSNDKAIDYVKEKLVKLGDNCILKGKWSHVRCFAHILNLVMQDRLNERGISVDHMRAVYEHVFDSFVEEDYVYACDLREGDGDEFEVDKKEGPPGIPESKD